MSDSLALSNKIVAKATGGEIEPPRYADLLKPAPKKPEETPDQVISRFDRLRRKKE